ncbi:MAG TPA: histidine phosphatase family protein [Rhizomicrobium sp.]|jgi:probable phosphoglycerate mutase|nr:histidine phosphatase family protein [Rhizomicrobium sp.]
MPLSPPAGLTLYFCRHGETEANVQKRFQGWTKDTSLTPKGREQSTIIARTLRTAAPDFCDLVYVSSPLPRARTTMEIVLTELGLPKNGYHADSRLQEINLGVWDGLTDAEARALDPAMFEKRSSDKWDVRVPGGENYADVAARAESWIGDLKADTFAVSHGAFTRILRGLFGGLSWKQMSDLDEKQGIVFRVCGSTVTELDAAN